MNKTNKPTKATNQPTTQQTDQTTNQLKNQPTNKSTNQPNNQSTNQPTEQPTKQPNNQPASHPTNPPPNKQTSRERTKQPQLFATVKNKTKNKQFDQHVEITCRPESSLIRSSGLSPRPGPRSASRLGPVSPRTSWCCAPVPSSCSSSARTGRSGLAVCQPPGNERIVTTL